MTTDWIDGWKGAAHDWARRQAWGMHFLLNIFHVQPTDRVLDLGCGPLCLGSGLIAYLDPGHYTGVDRDPVLLDAGRALLRHKGLESKAPTLVCTNDLSTVTLGPVYDVIWSHSVLIHMDPATVQTALDCIARHLAPGGTAYFTLNLGPHKILGEWTFGPNYQHPVPEHPCLTIEPLALLSALGDTVWCPPDSGMQATMLRATRTPHVLDGQRVAAQPAHAGQTHGRAPSPV